MKNIHKNSRVRTCQDVAWQKPTQGRLERLLEPPGAHLSARLCTNCHFAVGVQHHPSGMTSLPRCNLTSKLLTLNSTLGTVYSLRQAQGLKHQFCLAYVP